MQINIKNYYNLQLLLIFSFILRIIATYYYGDNKLSYEWSILFNNLYNSGTLAMHSFDGKLVPSVYMPPLYVFFIFLIKHITPENVELVTATLAIQIIFSTITVYLFYKLNNFFFTKNFSIFNSLIFSIFPLNIYTAFQISSACLQTFFLIAYLYLLFSLSRLKSFNILIIFYFALTSALLILLRGEFYFIFIVSLIYLFILKKINLTKLIAILLISLIIISPYLVRNYLAYNKITITKSLGYNLWKGNNLFSKIEGSESKEAYEHNDIYKKIEKIPKNNLYDFYYNDLFFKEGLAYITNNPLVFVERYIKKALSFQFFNTNSDYPNYYHPLFILPSVLTGVFSFFGIFLSLKSFNYEKGYLLLYLILMIGIFSVFFILPRYKMVILPVQLIFMNYFLLEFYKKFINK